MNRVFYAKGVLFRSVRTYKAPLVLFFLLLLFFVVNGAWHIPSRLVITGEVDSAVDAFVQWDSGSGFNDIEAAHIVLGRPVPGFEKSTVLKIKRTGNKHPSSTGTGVWIKVIHRSEDDHGIYLDTLVVSGTIECQGDVLHLMKDEVTLAVPPGRDSTTIIFLTNSDSGFAEIDVGGDRRSYDLYTPVDGEKYVKRDSNPWQGGVFTATVDLPRYKTHRLMISSIESSQHFHVGSASIVSQRETKALVVPENGFSSLHHFSGFHGNTKQYLQTVRFVQQVFFAAFCAYVLWFLMRFIHIKGGIAAFFFQSKRPFFWFMFIGSIVVFSTWLLAYWPGHFTSDSVHVWWAARSPGFFLFQHPIMNVIFYRFLQQFWDHMAVVGLVQIFMVSLLSSYIFYYLYKQGVSFWIIFPFYLAFITSVPVGLYNISLWKDIPFALLVLFWAFYFVKAVHDRKQGKKLFSGHDVVALALLLLALSLFRYNGIVYIFFIPAGMMLLKIISWRKFLFGLVFVLITSSVIVGISVHKDKTNFITGQTQFFIKKMLGVGAFKTVTRMVKQYPTILDVNIYQKRHIWYDVWCRNKATTAWHYNFAKLKGYNEFFRYVPCEPKNGRLFAFIDRITRYSYEKPWVYITWDPFYMLFLFLLCGLGTYLPRTAGFGYVVLTQVFVLLLVLGPENYNWRYYYFLLLSLYFLVPIVALDIKMRISSTG
ncbi:MAG: hypothetical protein JXB42_04695 [Deltaproteobacteria bacterium]|nr:hypothetical protein [Deltaproteobacteria bacterium]